VENKPSFHGNIEYLYNGCTILETKDKKHITAPLLQDVSKSFDSIEHSILFAKLRTLGISKTSLEWFKSYLSDPGQFVRLASQRSESRTIMQSMLGLILFSIYINDLPRAPSSSSLESSVDDSKVETVYFIRL
jgi:hypothetical protein